MNHIAIYGKGGSGKSMIASNLSVQFARLGLATTQIGCDPKHDSTLCLTGGRAIPTVISLMEKSRDLLPPIEQVVVEGVHGIRCIEAGGPEPGVGCAGRGIVSVFQILKRHHYLDDFEAVVLDVLGDVVCGGFAAPLMHGFASRVLIVVSDNLMSLYAANNIAKAVRRFTRNGARLVGLVGNNLHDPDAEAMLTRFAERLSTRLLTIVPHDPLIFDAERRRLTVSDHAPDSASASRFRELAQEIRNQDTVEHATPTPMDDEERESFFREQGR